MRFSAALSIALVSAVLPLHAAKADVQVTFVNSYRYSEFKGKPPSTRDDTLEQIRKTLAELGARYLKPEEVLKIEVLGIRACQLLDRAGARRGHFAVAN